MYSPLGFRTANKSQARRIYISTQPVTSSRQNASWKFNRKSLTNSHPLVLLSLILCISFTSIFLTYRYSLLPSFASFRLQQLKYVLLKAQNTLQEIILAVCCVIYTSFLPSHWPKPNLHIYTCLRLKEAVKLYACGIDWYVEAVWLLKPSVSTKSNQIHRESTETKTNTKLTLMYVRYVVSSTIA
jgi:hypothetical protein